MSKKMQGKIKVGVPRPVKFPYNFCLRPPDEQLLIKNRKINYLQLYRQIYGITNPIKTLYSLCQKDIKTTVSPNFSQWDTYYWVSIWSMPLEESSCKYYPHTLRRYDSGWSYCPIYLPTSLTKSKDNYYISQ